MLATLRFSVRFSFVFVRPRLGVALQRMPYCLSCFKNLSAFAPLRGAKGADANKTLSAFAPLRVAKSADANKTLSAFAPLRGVKRLSRYILGSFR